MPNHFLAWPLDELSLESRTTPFDCIVVGGGTAGLTAALTLAERDKRVAVLEAGPLAFYTNVNNTDVRYVRALTDNLRMQVEYAPSLPSGEPFGPNIGCLGGRSIFWNGAAIRFRRHDFEGWPFTANDLDAEYRWAEQEFRVTDAYGTTELARRIIDKLTGAGIASVPEPIALDPASTGIGRLGSGLASGIGMFLRRAGGLLAAGRIRVATKVLARRLLLQGNSVRGLFASPSDAANGQELMAKAVVLAAGGIESVKLAALSGVPDQERRIGVGIQDHLFYRSYLEAPELYGTTPDAGTVYVPSRSQATEQWEIHAPGRRFMALDDANPWSPGPDEPYQLVARSFASTEKRAENRVEARDGGLGSSIVHFSYSPADEARKAAMLNGSARLNTILGVTRSDGRFAGPGGSYHEAGGLDMGTDRKHSVTDPEGRFHTVQNLVCVDAAAFPRIGATNPHLTILAVSRRQSSRLAARL